MDRLNLGPICLSCSHTHLYEGVRYADCPWCSCLDYANPTEKPVILYFRSDRVRGARRREWRSKLGSYRQVA